MELNNDLRHIINSRNEIIELIQKENRILIENNLKYTNIISNLDKDVIKLEDNYTLLSKQYSKLINDYKNEINYTKTLDKANNKILDNNDSLKSTICDLKDNIEILESNNLDLKNDIKNLEANIKSIYSERDNQTISYQENISDLSMKYESLKSGLECSICASNYNNVIIDSCGHMCCCDKCIHVIINDHNLNKCPICSNPIQSWKKVYLPF